MQKFQVGGKYKLMRLKSDAADIVAIESVKGGTITLADGRQARILRGVGVNSEIEVARFEEIGPVAYGGVLRSDSVEAA